MLCRCRLFCNPNKLHIAKRNNWITRRTALYHQTIDPHCRTMESSRGDYCHTVNQFLAVTREILEEQLNYILNEST